jgi:hypothetical protein
MREQEITKLTEPYTDTRSDVDRRFDSVIGADVPSSIKLFNEITADLDTHSFGISWWQTSVQERILIGDYLYQCADGIEKNLVEAKLHYLEWLDVRERQNNRIADGIKFNPDGEPYFKHPASQAPIDDLINRMEGLHLCGFFRAIGSSLDCLGAVIIGVLGLDTSLRHSSIDIAERTLLAVKDTGSLGSALQIHFRDFFEDLKKSSGPEDWLEWADQYRNMFVHRGRRITHNQIIPREPRLFDSRGVWIPRANSTLHLAKYPDKSEAEALIKLDMLLNEDADETLSGIFRSTRELEETTCNRLLSIWKERRANPSLIQQPQTQWIKKRLKRCAFSGYNPNPAEIMADVRTGHPVMFKRLLAASADDAHRENTWKDSVWLDPEIW